MVCFLDCNQESNAEDFTETKAEIISEGYKVITSRVKRHKRACHDHVEQGCCCSPIM